ncbi:MAG: CDP-diacylglycerol--serine O-phosphatidyltransferase [Marinisporobacter sp.]|jgi:CDP-diacylglycerol--serine O-phosphatidyltransferase|nr:CDP-diacylglycerol--serine O-phosphatidyltransferase [Marinisporobacter sp.]
MKYKKQIPNIFTLLNLVLGILAILSVFRENYTIASVLIILAGIMDRMDGKLARKLDVVSDFGKELDSLCDLISFGVAPAVLIWNLNLIGIGRIGIGVTLIFVICGTIRLARYNVVDFEGVYKGIPITLCGGLIALMALYSTKCEVNLYVLATVILCLSYGMVSDKIRLKKR